MWFNVVSKDLWDEEGCIDDNHIADEIHELRENGFYEEMESTFSSELDEAATRQWLLDKGFTETKFD
ncbi:hypothetical protein [Xanthomonas phage JGB6]|nr:hypothetical protein [Xanthomonas phage JGB6]